MADASRVGYRTNGLSSALQLHHLSSRVGQTDGIAPPGVHQRRKPMDHAIADSHATVTISHSGVQESQDPPKRAMSRWSPPRTPCPILARGGVRDARAVYVRSITLGRIGGIQRHTPGSRPTPHVDETSGTQSEHETPKRADRQTPVRYKGDATWPAMASVVCYVTPARAAGAVQFADRRSRTDRQRSTSRPYASPAAAPSPRRSASMPSATSAAEWSPSRSPAGRACTRPP